MTCARQADVSSACRRDVRRAAMTIDPDVSVIYTDVDYSHQVHVSGVMFKQSLKTTLRLLLAACLLLLAFLGTMGVFTEFQHPNADPIAHWIDIAIASLVAVACAAGAAVFSWPVVKIHFHLSERPTPAVFLYPSVQALLLYALAAALMFVLGRFKDPYAHLLAFLAFCAFCVSASVGALLRPRWATTALAAVGWALILLGALSATSEAIVGNSIAEAGIIYFIPMGALPVLLVVAALKRRSRDASQSRAERIPPFRDTPGMSGTQSHRR